MSEIKVLGVCGGIASGKSKACDILVSELGCLAHIDSDSLAHAVYEPGSQAIVQVIEAFGEDLLNQQDGTIDRKKLGSIVFTDPSAMSRLEQIVWPHVKAKVNERIRQLKEDATMSSDSFRYPVIVLEGAVLLDAGWEDIVDGVWVVTVNEDIAQQRLETNRGLSASEAKKRILAQQPRRGIGNLADEVSNKVVSAVVANCGDLDDLRALLKSTLDDPSSWYSR